LGRPGAVFASLHRGETVSGFKRGGEGKKGKTVGGKDWEENVLVAGDGSKKKKKGGSVGEIDLGGGVVGGGLRD